MSVLGILTDPTRPYLSDEDAKKLCRKLGNAHEAVTNGIAAIGLLLASVDYTESEFDGTQIGLLLAFLGDLSFDLHDAYFAASPDYRAEYAKATGRAPA